MRTDITDGSAGVPLEVALQFVEVADGACTPIENAMVELWHANASGAYSAFDVSDGNTSDEAGTTFLRGFQVTSSTGAVTFRTVYPGWYPGRTPHLHVKALMGGTSLVSTQLYFDDATTASVYAQAPYAARGPQDTTNANDGLGRGQIENLLLDLGPSGAGYQSAFVMGVSA